MTANRKLCMNLQCEFAVWKRSPLFLDVFLKRCSPESLDSRVRFIPFNCTNNIMFHLGHYVSRPMSAVSCLPHSFLRQNLSANAYRKLFHVFNQDFGAINCLTVVPQVYDCCMKYACHQLQSHLRHYWQGSGSII